MPSICEIVNTCYARHFIKISHIDSRVLCNEARKRTAKETKEIEIKIKEEKKNHFHTSNGNALVNDEFAETFALY